MGYLIIRIEKRLPVKWERGSLVTFSSKGEVVEQIAVRHALKTPHQKHVAGVLSKHGYELGPIIGMTPATDWPLLGYVYTSPSKDGVGRSGSQLYRWPMRKTE